MTDPSPPKPKRFPFGEMIGLGALVISGLGLWNSWRANEREKPTEVVERKVAVPLVLRGQVEDDGRKMAITPVETSHSLDSIDIALPGGKQVTVGSDGILDADALQDALADPGDRKGEGRVIATVTARYVEAGNERTAKRRYGISYRWESGGLLSGRKLRLAGISRA